MTHSEILWDTTERESISSTSSLTIRAKETTLKNWHLPGEMLSLAKTFKLSQKVTKIIFWLFSCLFSKIVPKRDIFMLTAYSSTDHARTDTAWNLFFTHDFFVREQLAPSLTPLLLHIGPHYYGCDCITTHMTTILRMWLYYDRELCVPSSITPFANFTYYFTYYSTNLLYWLLCYYFTYHITTGSSACQVRLRHCAPRPSCGRALHGHARRSLALEGE